MKFDRISCPISEMPQRAVQKPFKGQIRCWGKYRFDPLMYPHLGENLGYVIVGRPINHPQFTGWMQTSAIVKHEGNIVETLNSIYELVGEEGIR